jgi:hypothetical protein
MAQRHDRIDQREQRQNAPATGRPMGPASTSPANSCAPTSTPVQIQLSRLAVLQAAPRSRSGTATIFWPVPVRSITRMMSKNVSASAASPTMSGARRRAITTVAARRTIRVASSAPP